MDPDAKSEILIGVLGFCRVISPSWKETLFQVPQAEQQTPLVSSKL